MKSWGWTKHLHVNVINLSNASVALVLKSVNYLRATLAFNELIKTILHNFKNQTLVKFLIQQSIRTTEFPLIFRHLKDR